MDTTQQISIHKAIWAIPLATLACVALLTGTWFMSDMMARHPDQQAWSLCLLALPLFPLVSVLLTRQLLPEQARRRHWLALGMSHLLAGLAYVYLFLLIVINQVGS